MSLKPVVLGLVKGAVIGGAVGYGAYHLGLGGGWKYVIYGAVGLLVGMIAGKPFWKNILDKNDTVWTSVLQGLVGVGVCIGLYALTRHALGDPELHVASIGPARVTDLTYLFAPIVGVIWGLFVEIDDSLDDKAAAKKQLAKKKK